MCWKEEGRWCIHNDYGQRNCKKSECMYDTPKHFGVYVPTNLW